MGSIPSEQPDWRYVVERVLPRLGMWTGRDTYERAVCFILGFDLATDGTMNRRLDEWAQARFGSTNIGWPWVLIRLAVGIPKDQLDGKDMGSLDPEEDAQSRALLRQALEEVLGPQTE